MLRFVGKSVIVTGAARGIGEAIARRFASEGAAVVVADRDGDGSASTTAGITASGGTAIGLRVDVTSAEDVDAMVAHTLDRFGKVDVLVNNAADTTNVRHFFESDEAWWDHFLDTNLKSQYLACRAATPSMARAGGGCIINMSSGGATRSHRGMVAYDASKGGVEALTRALALELAPYGIRVNALVPGLIETRPEHVEPAASALRASTVPMGRGGTGQDLAGPAAFLASDDAAYVTGATLVVDGGVLVQQRPPQVETFTLDRYPPIDSLV